MITKNEVLICHVHHEKNKVTSAIFPIQERGEGDEGEAYRKNLDTNDAATCSIRPKSGYPVILGTKKDIPLCFSLDFMVLNIL